MNAGCESVTGGAATAVSAAPRPVSRAGRRFAIIGFCLLGLAFNGLLFGPSLHLTLEGGNDFMSIYSGTRLAFTGHMYQIDSNLQVQRDAAGWDSINRLFMRPAFDALLMWPLGRLPYAIASHLWEVMLIGAVALFCWLWPGDRKVTAIACCWSFPLFHVWANGQDVALILIAVAWSFREMRRGNESRAGAILSLCSIKFHLLLLLPVLIVAQRRWSLLKGLAGGGAVVFAASFVPAWGAWPMRWLELLRNPVGNPFPDRMPNLYGLTYGMPSAAAWQIGASLIVAAAVWAVCRKGSFEVGMAAVLAGGILVSPHTYLSDCAMAVPALLVMLPRMGTPWARAVVLCLMSPMCWIWAMLQPTSVTTMSLIACVGLLLIPVKTPLRSTNSAMIHEEQIAC